MLSKRITLAIGLFVFLAGALVAQNYEYIGAQKCKMCHNKPATGKQYTKWSEARHSKAMESLKSEKAMEYAKNHNIADPSTDASCVKCHSTAGGTDKSLHAGITMEEGVSCESCHGPGSVYKTTTIMKDREKALANGLIIPDEKVCVSCHNEENPFHKPFDYETFKAKIAHPVVAVE